MLGVSFLTFGVFRVIPGDACVTTLGFGATPETIKDCQVAHGLDKPWYEQYWNWASNVATGDLGTSLTESDLPVNTELNRRLPVTLELMAMTMFVSLFLGIPPGVLSAIRPGTPLDWIARFSSVLWLSIPSFYLGILVITFGASWFNWTPPQFGVGYVSIFDDPWTNIQEFFFPSLVLALGISAVIMRLTRSSMLEVMRNDYIRTAWSKGLRERTVVWRHAVKNALIPVITLIGLQIGGLLGGSVIVESLFSLNGVGKYTLEAILRRDFIVVQSLVLLFATAYVSTNLIVDIAYAWLDPRIHYG
jgi:peptide/nickel transport system permease protein